MVARTQAFDAGAHLPDNASALVAAHDGQRPLAKARHDGEIRVAQTRSLHFDQNLAFAWSFQVDLFDPKRGAVAIRCEQTLFVHDRSGHSHGRLLKWES
jgi:hypothetical protein